LKTDPEIHARWLRERELCRTNLYYLCEVLGYKDVSPQVHGGIVANLQQFKGGVDLQGSFVKMGDLVKHYRPRVPITELEGCRKNLFLISRGFLKSSIKTIAHNIQWIINYPNVAIMLVSAVGDQAQGFLRELKGHFQTTERFRWLFPEFCPQKNPKEFGNADSFTVPCRTIARKEPTVSTITLTTTIAGYHCDVVSVDDLVDKENVKTSDQIQTVKEFFALLDPLVQNYSKPPDWPQDRHFQNKGWLDLVGTIYHFSDLHYSILEDQRKRKWSDPARQWRICLKSAAPNYPNGPATWPARYPLDELKKIELDPARGPAMLWAQYLLKPLPDKQGLVDSKEQLERLRMKKQDIDMIFSRMERRITVDIGGLDKSKKDNDDTVINYHGFGTDGRLYILKLLVGKFPPEEIINHLFNLYIADQQITEIKISEDALARMLMPFLKREMPKRGVFLPLKGSKIDNQQSKETKIKSLQPYIANDAIRFSEDLGKHDKERDIWHELVQQAVFFPKYVHDDIWDTIADALFNKDGSVTRSVKSQGRIMPTYKMVDGFGVPARVDSEDNTLLHFESAQPEAVASQLRQGFEEADLLPYDDMTGY
jgi:predicted phage terminase large subunit-like protein